MCLQVILINYCAKKKVKKKCILGLKYTLTDAVSSLTYRLLWVEDYFVDRACVARQFVQDSAWCGVPNIHKPVKHDAEKKKKKIFTFEIAIS